MIYPPTIHLLLQFIKAGIVCRCFTHTSVPRLGRLESQAQLGLWTWCLHVAQNTHSTQQAEAVPSDLAPEVMQCHVLHIPLVTSESLRTAPDSPGRELDPSSQWEECQGFVIIFKTTTQPFTPKTTKQIRHSLPYCPNQILLCPPLKCFLFPASVPCHDSTLVPHSLSPECWPYPTCLWSL